MHSTRPVVDMIAHSSADQIITCGVGNVYLLNLLLNLIFSLFLDLIIRIWRVFPYAIESLLVIRSIFCALPPIRLSVIRNSLAVAFRDEPTLTHSLMVYNLENNGKIIFF
jgi:hypothetical protein